LQVLVIILGRNQPDVSAKYCMLFGCLYVSCRMQGSGDTEVCPGCFCHIILYLIFTLMATLQTIIELQTD